MPALAFHGGIVGLGVAGVQRKARWFSLVQSSARRWSCKGLNPGQRLLALPAGVGALDRGAAAVPGFVEVVEVEQAFGEQRGRKDPPVYAPLRQLTLPSNEAPGSISRVS